MSAAIRAVIRIPRVPSRQLRRASVPEEHHLQSRPRAGPRRFRIAGCRPVGLRRGMRPVWRQVPEVLARYASETLGLSSFRLSGLLGSQPLAQTLTQSIDWEALHRNVEEGLVEAAAVTATSVRTGRVMVFTESASPVPRSAPEYHGRFVATRLDVSHLMASSAIPALFPSVHVDQPAEAAGWYVDGATRRRSPLAAALELGADRVVVVGTKFESRSERRAAAG